MKIAIGSTNPIKIQACEEVFKEVFEKEFEILYFKPILNDISNTPFTIEEMISGAKERATQAIQKLQSNYGIGVEGGIHTNEYGTFLTAYAVVIDRDDNSGIGGSPAIKLPSQWKIESNSSFELGSYVDSVSGKNNIKQSEGAMGILTNHKLVRKDSLKLAILCAYYSLINEI